MSLIIASFNLSNPSFLVEYIILFITSAPYFIWAFPADARPINFPEYKSTNEAATEVVPISKAIPKSLSKVLPNSIFTTVVLFPRGIWVTVTLKSPFLKINGIFLSIGRRIKTWEYPSLVLISLFSLSKSDILSSRFGNPISI